MINYKTVLVEDEPIAMQKLEKMLSAFSDKIQIVDKAVNGFEAVKKINKIHPDLIFLDIQIPGLNGFEVLKKLDCLPLIIFTTAYDQYALKAFETYAIDYLLKPISSLKMKKAIDKLKRFQADSQFENKIMELIKKSESHKKLAVQFPYRIVFYDYDEIYYFHSDNKYTKIHLYEKKYSLSKTLTDLEKELSNDFVRIHRSSLVNKKYIGEIIKLSSRKWIVRLTDKTKTELIVSRDYRNKLIG